MDVRPLSRKIGAVITGMSWSRSLVVAVLVGAVMVVAGGCSGHASESTSTPSVATTASTSKAAEPSRGCVTGQGGPVLERIDVTVDGRPRTALVHVPTSLRPGHPAPVVLSFHGVNGNAAVQQSTDGLLAKSDEEGFVVVHPEGLMVGLNDQVTGISGWDADGSEVDEPAFVAAVLDELEAKVCVDTARVYATGFSAGGNIALVVACALPDRIAAVAPVSAAYQPGECTSAPPVPVLAFHGLDDIVVPFGGRDSARAGTLLPVRAALGAQAKRNGCTGKPKATDLSPRVHRLTWPGCKAATALVELDHNGHAWPGHPMPFAKDLLVGLFAGSDTQPPNPLMVAIGSTPDAMADNVLLTNSDIDATDLIWKFFSQSS